VAAAVRVAGLLGIGHTGYADSPLVDAYTYWDQARQLLADKDPFASGYYQPPAYPYLLSWLFGATGGDASMQVVRIAQVGLGLLTTGLIIRLGDRFHDGGWLGPLAGALYALYATPVLFELDLLTPAVTCACLAGALLLADRQKLVPAGLLLGVAASVHPTYLLACGVLVGWAAWTHTRKAALFALVGVGLGLAPTTVSNAVRFDQVALVSHNSGINFYLGNNPDWKHTAFLKAGLPFRQLALEAEPHRRDSFERNDYWSQRAWAEIGEAPGAWLTALATKTLWSVNDREIPRNEDYRCRTAEPELAFLGRLPVRYGWVFPFAVLGALQLLGTARGRLLVLSWGALHLPMILYLVADRYRVATWPVVALLGARGVLAAGRALRSGIRPRSAVLFAGLAALPWLPVDRVTAFNPGWCAHVEANFAYADQDWERAEVLYAYAVSEDPGDLSALNWWGESLLRQGKTDAGIEKLAQLLSTFPDSYPTLKAMASACAEAGKLDCAAEAWGGAYRVPGPRTGTGVRYVRALVEAGRESEARAVVAKDPKLAKRDEVKELLGL